MTIKLIALTAALACATLAAHAGEGEGNPFPFSAPASSHTTTVVLPPDTGSEAYPDMAGRSSEVETAGAPGIVPLTGSEAPVQTANSLPHGFDQGTVAFAEEQSIRRLTGRAANQFAATHGGRLPATN